jgi:response regulator RpfG family c-di-GMP phosphodiesterase
MSVAFVIGDDSDSRNSTSRILYQLGYDIVILNCDENAAEKAAALRPEVILSEWQSAGSLTCLQQVRSVDESILRFVVAGVGKDCAEEALSTGTAHAVIESPLTARSFRKALEAVRSGGTGVMVTCVGAETGKKK